MLISLQDTVGLRSWMPEWQDDSILDLLLFDKYWPSSRCIENTKKKFFIYYFTTATSNSSFRQVIRKVTSWSAPLLLLRRIAKWHSPHPLVNFDVDWWVFLISVSRSMFLTPLQIPKQGKGTWLCKVKDWTVRTFRKESSNSVWNYLVSC